jgi:hypothetical protein
MVLMYFTRHCLQFLYLKGRAHLAVSEGMLNSFFSGWQPLQALVAMIMNLGVL